MEKIITVQKRISDERIDSFWYKGQVAYIDTDHGRYSLEAIGDIKVMFEPDGDWFIGQNAVDEAKQRNMTDMELSFLGEHDGWGNNNWFEIVFIDKNGNTDSGGTDEVEYVYDDAIQMLQTYVEEKVYA